MKEKMSVSGGRRLSLPPLRVGERQPHKLGCQTSEVRAHLPASAAAVTGVWSKAMYSPV